MALKTLIVEVNQKQARSSMIVVGTIAAVFVAFYFFAIATGQVDTGSGWLEIFVLSFFGWILGTLFYFTYWQFNLGRFNGPLITFTTNGFMDHMQTPPREISWADIKYIKFFKNSKMLIPGMHIQLKHPSLKDRIRQIFGVYRYRYAGQILSVSTDEIKSFLYEHAPRGVFK